jgi:SAM-dependent methyltransferase
MNTYDELPYESGAIHATSPVRLSLVAGLHGGPRPPVEGYRALELGCGNGGNLLPLAFYHPGSEFLGVDSSEGALASARDAARELGLRNVRFELAELSRPEPLLRERFHYVLVHGVLSWVAEEVRAGILEVCAACPSADGLVYLSYNVRSGWAVRTLVRELLLEEVGSVEPLRERVHRAKELATRLREALGETQHAQQVQLAWELERVARSADSYLFHEYLLEVNRPFHHREVVDLLRGRRLAYLCDSSFNEPAGREPDGLREALDRLEARGGRRESLVDFLGCRAFRSSVFCRDEARTDREERRLEPSCFVAGDLRPEKGPPDLGTDAEESFVHARGATLRASGAILKATLGVLAGTWPRYVRADDLAARAFAAAGRADLDAETLAVLHRDLLAMYEAGLVDLQPVPPRGIGGEGRGRPHALARLEARRGSNLTTALHTLVPLTEEARVVVRMLAAGREADAVAAGRPVEEHRAILARWGLLEGDGPGDGSG